MKDFWGKIQNFWRYRYVQLFLFFYSFALTNYLLTEKIPGRWRAISYTLALAISLTVAIYFVIRQKERDEKNEK